MGAQNEQPNTGNTFVEQMEVAGNQLVDRIKELRQDSSTKRVIIKDQDGDELLSMPLDLGVVAGGILTLGAPGLAAIGAVAALVTKVKLEVVREHSGSVQADRNPDQQT